MARGIIAHTEITRSGVAPAAEVNGDATNGHQTNNDGQVEVIVRNSNGSSTARWVRFVIPGAIDGQTVTPRQVSIPAGETRKFYGFPVEVYGNPLLIDVEHAEIKLAVEHKTAG